MGPLDAEEPLVELGDRGRVDEQQRHLGVGPEPLDHALLVEHELREAHPTRDVDLDLVLLVGAEHRRDFECHRTTAHVFGSS